MRTLLLFCGLGLACVTALPQQLATNAVANPKIKREPVWLEKYDVNKNGVLDPDERSAL